MKNVFRMLVVLSIVGMSMACTPKQEVKDENVADSTAQVDTVSVDTTGLVK